MGRDKLLFSSHDKGSLSSFERYEHHDAVVNLGQLDGMWCKDPLIKADLPATKQSCSLPTQRSLAVFQPKGTSTQNLEAKSNHLDVISQKMSSCYCGSMILGTKRDGSRQEPKVTLIPLFKINK